MACLRDSVGGSLAFHSVGGWGYTTDVRNARVYTLAEAQMAWDRGRDIDQPISASHIDKCLVWKVDHQYVPCEDTILSSTLTKYVAFKKEVWCGNDLYFKTHDELIVNSTDFNKSQVMCNPEKDKNYISIPYYTARDASRPTFRESSINRRKMITGAGLRQPEHITKSKRKRRSSRQSTGLNRLNCPSCGRIAWQYNPYDFDECKNPNCNGVN
jgi:hypothetical protein